MKHLFLTILIGLFCFSAKSQITKSNWLVGGTSNFSSSKQNLPNSTDKNNSTTFSILPNIGYFVVDKFAMGLGAGISFLQSKSNDIKSNVTSYSIGPFARYYFLDTDKTTNLFIQGKFGYGISRFNNLGNPISKSKNLSYSLTGGPVVYFNSSVGLEFTVGWTYEKALEDKSSVSSAIVGIGFQIHLEK